MRWGGFLREETETEGRVAGLRWGGGIGELDLVGPPAESCSRPFQPGFCCCALATQVPPALSRCTGLSPLPPGLGSQLRFPLGCHAGDKVWLAGGGWEGDGGAGGGLLHQPEVGAGAPAAMRYPPWECGLAAPPLERSGELLAGRADTQQTGCSAPGWPPTLPSLKAWHRAACGGHTLTLLEKLKLSGSLKQFCCQWTSKQLVI